MKNNEGAENLIKVMYKFLKGQKESSQKGGMRSTV